MFIVSLPLVGRDQGWGWFGPNLTMPYEGNPIEKARLEGRAEFAVRVAREERDCAKRCVSR
ncbi:hypothetical protein WH91_11010 [Devosia psychrophila]|uniref:Uncharacterized protein n=1 Tax=Devosia psychrophila TaxID=728005 RepID=A0ABR5DYC3_9HYPH|nr:hypothetical protein WH91_11010 [Devosia psychrophila]